MAACQQSFVGETFIFEISRLVTIRLFSSFYPVLNFKGSGFCAHDHCSLEPDYNTDFWTDFLKLIFELILNDRVIMSLKCNHSQQCGAHIFQASYSQMLPSERQQPWRADSPTNSTRWPRRRGPWWRKSEHWEAVKHGVVAWRRCDSVKSMQRPFLDARIF